MKKLLVLVFCTFWLTGLLGTAVGEDYQKPQELVDQSTVVVKKFIAEETIDSFKNFASSAKALFIIPRMLKGGLVIGGSGGSGVLVSRDSATGDWGYPVFYTMGSVSFGLQAGAEASEMILLVMTDRGMDSMLTSSFKLGADASIAAGPVGVGAKAATADILAYSFTKGVYGGMSLEGAVIKTRDKWNSEYYGKEVSPADIVIRKIVQNPHADNLREAIAGKAGGKS
jgi:lipid-binding SYLF domain-containing protein